MDHDAQTTEEGSAEGGVNAAVEEVLAGT